MVTLAFQWANGGLPEGVCRGRHLLGAALASSQTQSAKARAIKT